MPSLIKIQPNELSGPRSFFTDIDINDNNYDAQESLRKLKLQLLTKEKIVVPASSMFKDIWLQLFKENKGLIPAIEEGIIIPAIRDQFETVEDFFSTKDYGIDNKEFYMEHVTHSVPWNLEENSSWFFKHFTKSLSDKESVLRTKGNLSKDHANEILLKLNFLVENEDLGAQFLQRKHIGQVASSYDTTTQAFLSNYANLIYRLSGSRVVNSEGHFPQSNLTALNIVGNDQILSDENLFWDIYAETVFSYLGSSIRMTPERLDNLEFSDILSIRKTFFDLGFSQDYDNLVKSVKSQLEIKDPDKLILHMHEISSVAKKLKEEFEQKVKSELSIKDTSESENALWQVANVVSLLASPSIGLAIGTLSVLKSIPEITAPISPALSKSFEQRINWLKNFVNEKVGWSETRRKSFLDAYKELAIYGLR